MTESAIEIQPEQQAPLPAVDFIDRLRFIPFELAFVLILLVFDLPQRIAMLFGARAQQEVVVWLNASLRWALAIVGVKLVVDGARDLPAGRPYIIVANHQSLFDIPILHTIFRRHLPRFIAKQELAKWLPSVSYNLRNGGSAVIDRSNPRQALPEIKALGERMTEQCFAAVIFPEGTRARRGEMKPFRHAGVSTLIQTAQTAAIIPVVIENSWVLSSRKLGPIPRGTVVRVRVLPELDRNGLSGKEMVEKAEAVIRSGLDDIRAEQT